MRGFFSTFYEEESRFYIHTVSRLPFLVLKITFKYNYYTVPFLTASERHRASTSSAKEHPPPPVIQCSSFYASLIEHYKSCLVFSYTLGVPYTVAYHWIGAVAELPHSCGLKPMPRQLKVNSAWLVTASVMPSDRLLQQLLLYSSQTR